MSSKTDIDCDSRLDDLIAQIDYHKPNRAVLIEILAITTAMDEREFQCFRPHELLVLHQESTSQLSLRGVDLFRSIPQRHWLKHSSVGKGMLIKLKEKGWLATDGKPVRLESAPIAERIELAQQIIKRREERIKQDQKSIVFQQKQIARWKKLLGT